MPWLQLLATTSAASLCISLWRNNMGNASPNAKNMASSTPTNTQASKVAADINASASSGVDGSEPTTLFTAGPMQDNNNANNKLSNAGETTQSVAGNDAVVGASAASSSAPSHIGTNAAAAAATSTSSTGGSAKKKKKHQGKIGRVIALTYKCFAKYYI